MRTSSRIALNVLTGWAGHVVVAVLAFFMVPFLLRKVGKDGYGLLAIVGSIIGLAGIIDLGMRQALCRHLAGQVATKNTRRFNEFASSALGVYLGMGVLAATICVVLAPLLARWFRVPANLMPEGLFLLRYYGPTLIILSFVSPIFGGVLASNKRFDILSALSASSQILKATAVFLVLGLTGAGLRTFAVISVVTTILSQLARWHFALRIWPSLRVRPALIRRDCLSSLFSLGGYMFTAQMAGRLSVQSDPLVISWFLGIGPVALYRPALSLCTRVRPLISMLSGQLHPFAAAYHALGKKERLQAILIRGTRYTFLMGIAIYVFLGVFGQPLTRVWLRDAPIAEQGRTVLEQVLMAWVVIDLLTHVTGSGSQWAVLVGMNRLRFVTFSRIAGAIVNLAGSILLVKYTGLGVIGVVVPTIVVHAIRRPLLVIYTARVCGLSSWTYIRSAFLKPIIVLGLVAMLALGVRELVKPDSFVALGICALSMAVLWAPLCWWIGFNASDRKSFRDLLRRGISRIGPAGRAAPVAPAAPGEQAVAETLDDEVADEIRQSEEII